MTWWFARQLIAGDAITGRSVDWQMEAATAVDIQTNQGDGVDQGVENSIEDLVSPSIRSGVESDGQAQLSARMGLGQLIYNKNEKRIRGISFSVAVWRKWRSHPRLVTKLGRTGLSRHHQHWV